MNHHIQHKFHGTKGYIPNMHTTHTCERHTTQILHVYAYVFYITKV